MASRRKYPVGIQSFERIRKDGFVYVDKTPLIHRMITEGTPCFLSRPRRFGKSLLVSTLAAVFEGRRELFEAFTTEDGVEQPPLYIATTDWRWERHPVIRFDFSVGDLHTIEQLDELIDYTLGVYEKQYGITPVVNSPNIRMKELLRTAHEQTGRGVVVLVDEYDNFILHALGDREKVEMARSCFQNVFAPLKEMDGHLRFVFITGISKFSQMGVFSKLNQLRNISMLATYETLCGISEEELAIQLRQDVAALAERNDSTYDDMLLLLKSRYDGYHFSKSLADVYNPFSLFNALQNGELDDYWFASGTSGALIELMTQMPPIDLSDINGVEYEANAFDKPFDSYSSPLPILYQSGYLTIKGYDSELAMYTLGLPNQEVSRGFADCLYQHIIGRQDTDDADKSRLMKAFMAFRRDDDLPRFVEAMRTFYAGIPYQWENGNRNEHYYHAILYTLLTAFGADIRVEESGAKGTCDLTLFMPKGIYVMELKYDHTAQEALDQINRRGYADRYMSGGCPVTKVGISFSSEERNITEWLAERHEA